MIRTLSRIPKMLLEISALWQTHCPDLRLGQLIYNFYLWLDADPFYIEDEDMMELIRKYFKETFNDER